MPDQALVDAAKKCMSDAKRIQSHIVPNGVTYSCHQNNEVYALHPSYNTLTSKSHEQQICRATPGVTDVEKCAQGNLQQFLLRAAPPPKVPGRQL